MLSEGVCFIVLLKITRSTYFLKKNADKIRTALHIKRQRSLYKISRDVLVRAADLLRRLMAMLQYEEAVQLMHTSAN